MATGDFISSAVFNWGVMDKRFIERADQAFKEPLEAAEPIDKRSASNIIDQLSALHESQQQIPRMEVVSQPSPFIQKGSVSAQPSASDIGYAMAHPQDQPNMLMQQIMPLGQSSSSNTQGFGALLLHHDASFKGTNTARMEGIRKGSGMKKKSAPRKKR
jgi:hypothetical protein